MFDVDELCRAFGLDVAVPEPMQSTDGALIAMVPFGDGRRRRMRVTNWLHGATSLTVTSSVARRAGEVLASLHSVGEPEADPPDRWFCERHRGGDWGALADAAIMAGEPWGDALSRQVDELDRLDQIAAAAPVGRPRTCHRDFTPLNVVATPADGFVVLDWDNAGPLDAPQELAILSHECREVATTSGQPSARRTPVIDVA